ncbi:TlpA family protein disulfide reductase [Aeromicrobium wangtongii]|uniref:TlpA family protein disulfide reductase n=1 Tax=Aeromicrobium wangtongii TaxID=2969247 RepID=A0ABY5M878_9ACTN|nr:TlpA disulfide reductase family protein [Aeromicrobium wangtongii]MCD9200056.1 TlpA family protein disulfide reductase [Aeromicrobium wangtongii]UUP13314.1 TlpA family protein disulfide reductase [Aeromicrobium wangtongii]
MISLRARSVAAIGALALLAACGGVGNRGTTSGFVSGDGSITRVDAADREKAPVLEGEGLDGKPLSTADFAGKTIVVNLWGPWCAPCRAEAPALEEVASEYASKDVQFVGMLTRTKDPASAIAFNRKFGVSYPSFTDQGGKLELAFNDSLPTTAIPTTWIIDAEGRVAARVIDKVSASTLANLIDDVQKSTA